MRDLNESEMRGAMFSERDAFRLRQTRDRLGRILNLSQCLKRIKNEQLIRGKHGKRFVPFGGAPTVDGT